jgi:hypothetical protein
MLNILIVIPSLQVYPGEAGRERDRHYSPGGGWCLEQDQGREGKQHD